MDRRRFLQQSRFVGDHLGRFTEAFAGSLREASPLPFYAALADLLTVWVKAEVERLGAAPSVVLGPAGYDPIQEADAFTCPMAEPEPDLEEADDAP